MYTSLCMYVHTGYNSIVRVEQRSRIVDRGRWFGKKGERSDDWRAGRKIMNYSEVEIVDSAHFRGELSA